MTMQSRNAMMSLIDATIRSQHPGERTTSMSFELRTLVAGILVQVNELQQRLGTNTSKRKGFLMNDDPFVRVLHAECDRCHLRA